MSTLRTPRPTLLNRLRALIKPEGEELIRITTYVIVFIMLLSFILDEGRALPPWRFYGTIAVLAFILVFNILDDRLVGLFNQEYTGHLVFVLTSSVLMLVIAWLGNSFNVIYLFFMITAQAFITLKFRTALGIILGLAVAYMLLLQFMGLSTAGMFSVLSALAVGLVFVSTLSVVLTRYAAQTRRAEQLAADLRQANADLLAARQREAELAVAEERVRLARDIHDGLGHHLTVLNIQLQAAGKMIDRDPAQAAEVIATCREEARLAMEEVRQSVAVMRQSPLDGKSLQDALAILISSFNRGKGLQASLRTSGPAEDLSQAAAITLYRAVQEGLTNAHKHAQDASRVEVELDFLPSETRLRLWDDGKGSPDSASASGFGLAGLSERVEQLGGRIEFDCPPAGGFQIQVYLPQVKERL